jgi:hypothetical protein
MRLQRCTTLPARLARLREPFVKLLGRTRQCHMRVLLKKHCGTPADAAEDKLGPPSAPGGASGSSSDVCVRGSNGPGFVCTTQTPGVRQYRTKKNMRMTPGTRLAKTRLCNACPGVNAHSRRPQTPQPRCGVPPTLPLSGQPPGAELWSIAGPSGAPGEGGDHAAKSDGRARGGGGGAQDEEPACAAAEGRHGRRRQHGHRVRVRVGVGELARAACAARQRMPHGAPVSVYRAEGGYNLLISLCGRGLQVVRFLHSVLEHIVPEVLWGGDANKRSIYDSVSR